MIDGKLKAVAMDDCKVLISILRELKTADPFLRIEAFQPVIPFNSYQQAEHLISLITPSHAFLCSNINVPVLHVYTER
jgi:hypothetical protein